MASQNQLQNHTLATQSAARVYAKLILYGFKTSNFVVACTGGFDIPVFGSKPLNDFREAVFNYVIVFPKVHEIFSLAFFIQGTCRLKFIHQSIWVFLILKELKHGDPHL